jgi:bacteriocin biosynthesis cyclodehydratase domain-containing protein
MFYSVASQCEFVSSDKDIALFVRNDNRLLIKHPNVDLIIRLFQFLKNDFLPLVAIAKQFKISAEQLQPFLDRLVAEQILDQVEDAALLEVAPSEREMAQEIFGPFSARLKYMATFLRRVKESRIRILNLTERPVTPLESALHKLAFQDVKQIHSIDTIQADEFFILVHGVHSNVRLLQCNETILRKNLTGLPLQVGTIQGSIGPILGLGSGPCLRCLVMRRKSNQPTNEHQAIIDHAPSIESGAAFRNVTFDIISSFTAAELLKYFSKCMVGRLAQGQYKFDCSSASIVFHNVFRVPNCPSCASGVAAGL